jgi:hypothetical protein
MAEDSYDFLNQLLGRPAAEGERSAATERWKDTAMFHSVKDKNSLIRLAKYMATLNSDAVNDQMQKFYQSVKNFGNDPIQHEGLSLLIKARDLAIEVLINLDADIETTHAKFFAGWQNEDAGPPASQAKADLPPIKVLLGGFESRREFLDSHLRREVSGRNAEARRPYGNLDMVYHSWH